MAAIETTASDIETAIAQGLAKLNLIRAEVKIEVLEEGSRGVLGIGAKPARVRLTPFDELEAAALIAMPQPDEDAEATSAAEPISLEDEMDDAGDDAVEDDAHQSMRSPA